MDFYIDNRSGAFVQRAYRSITEHTKATVVRAILFNRGAFRYGAMRFLRKKGVYDIEYVIYGTRALRRAIFQLNRKVKHIFLTVVISAPLTERDKRLLSLARSEVKVIDTTDVEANRDFYKSSKHILYRFANEDTILDHDIMHIYKFFESRYQCKFSSCLGNVLYVDRDGKVYFCPYHTEESAIGTIYEKKNYFKEPAIQRALESAITKRQTCSAECQHFSFCNGGCPLEDGCLDFPALFQRNTELLDGIISRGDDLSRYNLAIAKMVIKDITYGE